MKSSVTTAGQVMPRTAKIELGAMTGLILSYIWIWEQGFPGHFAVVVAAFLVLGLGSHIRRGETLHDLGFRLDNLRRAGIQALIYVGPLVLAPFLIGVSLDTLRPTDHWLFALAARIPWGLLQQYGLLCFFYRRLREVLPGVWPPMLSAASLFALFHLPNPFLTAFTLGAGVLSCWLYRRVPNVWALGIAHGLVSFSLTTSLPLGITVGLRVGPGFFRMWERLHSGAFLP